MKIVIKSIAVVLTLVFFGFCFVSGSEKEEAAYQAKIEQQKHDLQVARMQRVTADQIHE